MTRSVTGDTQEHRPGQRDRHADELRVACAVPAQHASERDRRQRI